MKIAIEAYASVFIICLCVLLGVCLITADLGVASARDAYETYTLQLQDSNYADTVAAACRADAANRGYVLNIVIHEIGDGSRSGSVEMQYEYSIPIIGYTAQRYIRGYTS